MITITIDNSFSQITGLSIVQFKRLREYLSYKIDNHFSSQRFNNKRYCIDLRGTFPTGLEDKVRLFLKSEHLVYNVKDLRKVPESLPMNLFKSFTVEPYAAQWTAMHFAVCGHRGTISMPTGTGKSLVIAMIIAGLNVRTLIIVPNIEIKKQLIASLNEHFYSIQHITVENIDSSALIDATSYDCLIIDEAHHVAAKTYQKLNKTAWKNVYYRFFLTATPFRNNKDETLLFEGIAGRVIYQLSYKEAVDKGYIAPVEAYYIELPKVSTDAYTWAEVYKELIVENGPRNGIIAALLKDLETVKKSTLCLVKEVQHGENIQDLYPSGFANGQDESSRELIGQFNARSITSLIGTTGLLGEGVDTKPCEFVIIAGIGKAKSAFLQQVGRAVRKYPGKESAKVILFRDPSHKFTLRHFKAQCLILKEFYGIIPQKLEF